MNVWRYLPFRQLSAFENMAIDEAIFRENQLRESAPTLRLYGWLSPSVSLGYFQNMMKEVDVDVCRSNGYDIVRRPTGGKAVFHDNDLTYSIIAKTKNPFFTDDIIGTYKVISRCIARGLEKINIKAYMAEKQRNNEDDSLKAFCFSIPSLYELLVDGKKICGSAQVRSHGSFLQHGSLMVSFDSLKTYEVLLPHLNKQEQVDKLVKSVTSIKNHTDVEIEVSKICCILKQGFEETLGIRLVDGHLTAEEEDMKRQLMAKYTNARWTMEGKYEVIFNRPPSDFKPAPLN